MPFCSAFNRFNSPCLKQVPDGQDVCCYHVNFYKPEVWFKRFPFSEDGERTFYFSSTTKLHSIYKKGILEGRIPINKEHFTDMEQLDQHGSLVDYYLFCCQRADVDPLWSNKMFQKAITEVLNCHKQNVFWTCLANKDQLYRFLDPIFNNKVRPFSYMVCNTLYVSMILESTRNNGRSSAGANLNNAEVSLIQYIKAHPKFTDFLWEHSDKEEKVLALANNKKAEVGSCHEKIKAFLESLAGERISLRAAKAAAIAPLREEIVAAVYELAKPGMFMDFQEYKELRQRWNF
jgi:hypothetical protein